MFTKKLKLIAVSSLVVVGSVVGIAAAQGGGEGRPERAEMRAKMLEKFDANKDGKLDDGERQVMHAERADERFSQLDTNKDGVLSKAEFAAQKMGHRNHHKRDGRGPGSGLQQ